MPTTPFPQLVGPSMTLRSPLANLERTVNWWTERQESDTGKGAWWLMRSPGLKLFSNSGVPGFVRCAISLNGHTYWVVGAHVLEVFADGGYTDYGALVVDDGQPAYMAASPTQIMITSGGNGYYLGAPAGPAQITDVNFPTGSAGPCAFMDGYFIVVINNSQQFQWSNLNDVTNWTDPVSGGPDIASKESRPDFLRMIWENQEQLWMFGDQTVQVFYDSGNPTEPFVPNQSAVFQQGCVAPASVQHVRDSLFWLGGDDLGTGVVYTTTGYEPQRVSNYGVENAIQQYPTITDAIGMAFQMNGHYIYRIFFPSANSGLGATWQLDIDTGQWTEMSFYNTAGGVAQEEAHLGRVIVEGFGMILVGSRRDSKIYTMSLNYLDDDGATIRSVRRCPHLYQSGKRVVYHMLGLDGNKGLGDPAGPAVSTVMSVRWSDDGGKTWGNPREINFGTQGQYNILPRIYDLGVGRDRVFEIECSGAYDFAITTAYLDISQMAN